MFHVLLEDNHLLAVNKPAGLLSQSDDTGDPSLVEEVADYLRLKYAKPGNVFVGLVHRLDRPVSGVMLLARTSKAASRLTEQVRGRVIEKRYLAVVEGLVPDDEGEWVDDLIKDTGRNVVEVARERASHPAAKFAHVAFRVLERRGRTSLVELRPKTGRSHQLRVQLSSRGHPIVGDLKYGAGSRLKALEGGARIALHAHELKFIHPTRREEIAVQAPIPSDWPWRPIGR